jgi:hypothetical protein
VAAKAARKPRPDDVEYFDVEQRGEDWQALRRGLPTASKFSVIMASGEDGEDSVTRTKLLHVLVGEELTGETAETFRNEAMEKGIEMEPEARDYYSRTTFAEVKQIGFVKRTIHNPLGEPLVFGCSPDALVDDQGTLEIKWMRPDLLIAIARKGAAGLPVKHRAQCQGTLWGTGRKWCDLQLYSHRLLPKPRFRMERDEIYIKKIREAVEVFAYEQKKIIDEMRRMAAR